MNHTTKRRLHRRAFSLIELLIVIAIMLALGGLVAINLMGIRDQSDVDLQRAQFDQIDAAMKHFKMAMRRYPSEEEGVTALWRSDALDDEEDAPNWKGPYLEDPVTKDVWGHELVYQYPGEIRGEAYYDLVSLGPDGEEGTDDDITNHDRVRGEDGEVEEEFDFDMPDDSSAATG